MTESVDDLIADFKQKNAILDNLLADTKQMREEVVDMKKELYDLNNRIEMLQTDQRLDQLIKEAKRRKREKKTTCIKIQSIIKRSSKAQF